MQAFQGTKMLLFFALEMDPVQIRIANIIARSPDEENKREKSIAEIAYIENDVIVVKPVTQF